MRERILRQPGGMGLSLRGKSRRRPVAFNPAQISAVSAWLRLANGTVTGSGYSSVPDLLGATSPATQGTDANRPVNATSANGLPIANFTNHVLNWPLSTANNGAVQNGLGCWCKSTLSGLQNLFAIWNGGSGASAQKADFFLTNANLQYFAEVGGVASKTSFMSANAWHFVTVEEDGAQATDQLRCLVTVDNVVLATTNTSIPTSQPTPTGTMAIGAFKAGTQPWVGSIGPNIYSFNRQLTTAERALILNFEVPN